MNQGSKELNSKFSFQIPISSTPDDDGGNIFALASFTFGNINGCEI